MTINVAADLLDGVVGSAGARVTSIIDGTAVAGNFTLDLTGNNNFSGATLTGVDTIALGDSTHAGVNLTLSANQGVDLGSKIVDNGDTTQLNITGLTEQSFTLSGIKVDKINPLYA